MTWCCRIEGTNGITLAIMHYSLKDMKFHFGPRILACILAYKQVVVTVILFHYINVFENTLLLEYTMYLSTSFWFVMTNKGGGVVLMSRSGAFFTGEFLLKGHFYFYIGNIRTKK